MGNFTKRRNNPPKQDNSYFANLIWILTNFIRRNRRLYIFAKGLRSIKRYGFKKTAMEIAASMRGRYSSLGAETFVTKAEKTNQKNTVFPKKIKISIIVQLFNTEEYCLSEMLESVISQTYANWELCLADGSDKSHLSVKYICKNYTQKDSRIKYRKFNKNFGVSEKLNKAIKMSSGQYIGILEQNDVLHPSALHEVMKVICNEDSDLIYSDEAGFSGNLVKLKHHKPDFAVDTLCSHNYIGHFLVFDKKFTSEAGVFRSEFDGCQDHDLILRYADNASKISHIPKLLYFRRDTEKTVIRNTKQKPEPVPTAEKSIQEYLNKKKKTARVERKIGLPGFYRAIYDIKERPEVSIIIPNKDNASLLRDCISSIFEKTTYENYEIIIVENNSSDDAIFAFYEELKSYSNIHILYWKEQGFNYSEICNFGAKYAHGQHLVFLNNDVMIISPNWIEEMLMYSQRDDVGAVGAKLYFLNGSIQHAGVILGLGGIAGHIYYGAPHQSTGFMGKLQIVQNVSAVTAACMMVRKQVFTEVGSFAPEFFASFNDIDLCIKIRKAGYLIVWTPYAEAYHLESRSRGYNTTSKKQLSLAMETALFKARWGKELAMGDPYYNCNLSLDKTDYSPK